MRTEWALDPRIVYLNHGTVGATPRRVLARQQAIRDEMERQPARFLLRECSGLVGAPRTAPTLLRLAAAEVADFCGCEGDDLVFVDNATAGVNAVLQSLELQAGDEILVTDHTYGAVTMAAAFFASRAGARVVTATVPYPRFDRDEMLQSVSRALSSRTRLAILDHVSSESALVMPLAELAGICHTRGVPVLGDGAHAPGAIALDLCSLGVDWYTGNLHKWAWAPRSCGFLWTVRERQPSLHPVVISWGLGAGYTREFDWVGTRDPSPFLAAPEGIAFMRELGVEAVGRWNHDLAWQAAQAPRQRLGHRTRDRREVHRHDGDRALAAGLRLERRRRNPAAGRPAGRGRDRGAAARLGRAAVDAGIGADLQRNQRLRAAGGRCGDAANRGCP